MKKRILSVFMAMCLVLTLLPVSALAVEGEDGNLLVCGPEDDLTFSVGDEVVLQGGEGTTTGWTYGAKNGYLDDGMVLTAGNESTNQLTFRFDKAGKYKAQHTYREDPDVLWKVDSDYFEITVTDPAPTMADLEMYTEYTEMDTLPDGVESATFPYVLTYHGTGGFGGVDPSFDDDGTVAMEATVTAAKDKVLLAPVDGNLARELPEGYYTLAYVNEADSDAGSEIAREETIYFQVTDFGAINVGTSQLARDQGKSSINSENVPAYSTITLNSGVFEDVATEEPEPEPEPVKTTNVSVAVGTRSGILYGQGADEDVTHTWTLEDGSGKYVSLNTYSDYPDQVTVNGIAAGTATLIHRWGDQYEIFVITVEGFTVADALEQISAQLDRTVELPDGMDSLDAGFTLDTYYWGATAPQKWEIKTGSTPISLKATLKPGESVHLATVDAADASLDLNADTFHCYVVSFDDPDGEGNLESNQTVCFKVVKNKITFYYMEDVSVFQLTAVPDEDLADATTITVSGTYPTDFEAYIQETNQYYVTLQGALDAAEAGQTVVLCKDLTDVAVTVETPNLTLDLSGFEISGQVHPVSDVDGSDPQPVVRTPAAITIGSNATGAGEEDQPQVGSFTLKSGTIKSGTISKGTGLKLFDDLTTLTVENVIFKDNVAADAYNAAGGAAVCWRASDQAGVTIPGTSATFTNCEFLNNKSDLDGDPNGGAVALNNVETVSFTDCTFTGNTSTGTNSNNSTIGNGGAVYLDYCGTISFDDCDFSDNSAAGNSGGGAVFMQINGTASFTDCVFTGNDALAGGGGAAAITLTGSTENNVAISGCTFTGNSAKYGGAMWLYSNSTVELTGNTIDSNTGTYGGAIYLQNSHDVILTGDITNNQATYGGAISGYQFALEMTGNLTGNTASTLGGAVYCTGSSELTVKGNLTQNKTDGDGGAIYAKWTQDSATGAVSKPEISITGNMTENSCTGDGGAVYSNIANITVNGTVTGNTAGGSGGGIYSFNGAPEYYPSTVDLTNASVYNNKAETAGADIYHTGGTLTISPVGTGWMLDSCGHMIDGWYTDAADARWDADGAQEHVTKAEAGTYTDAAALIAAHSNEAATVTIAPADIVVYTGGIGYGGVTDGDGNIIENTVTSGLPEPGYHLTLSADLVDMLPNGAESADDLSNMLRFQYKDEATGEITRDWGLEYRGVYALKADGVTPASYVYSLTPATVGDEQIPVRIQYTDSTNKVVSTDDIDMTASAVSAQYGMTIDPGELDQSRIQAVLTIKGKDILCKVKIGTGELTVKSTTNKEYRNEIGTVDDDRISATAAGVTYYVNDSEVAIEDPSRVQLLVDSVSNNEDFNSSMEQDAIGHADAQDGVSLSNAWAEAFYLDLVDTLNGNAVVTMGEEQKLTIYWPMPDGADEDGEFYIVHYDDMDRTAASGLQNDPEIIDVDVTSDGDHLTFQVGSFSPFVLVYERERSSGGGSSRPSRPTLNTEDHYSYIIGYSDGTLQPYGTITRGEVATIFFRLLTDDSREEYWSQVNDYTDCSSDLWCNNAISTLTNMGIIDGFSDGTFRPYAKITRAQFAKIAVGFFETTREDYQGYFTDVDIDAWYTEYVEAAARVGLIEGFNDGTFRPNTNITRAQACVIVNRALGRAPDEDRLLDEDEMITWPDNNPDDWFYADMQEATNSHDYTWVTVSGDKVENWTDKLPQRDWAALEHAWSTAHSAPGGEVTE